MGIRPPNATDISHSAYPRWDEQGTPDIILSRAETAAYKALLEITNTDTVGKHVGVRLPINIIDATGASAQEENKSGAEKDQDEGTPNGVSYKRNIMLTHLFESAMRGYRGWQWFVTLSRSPDSEKVTISELGLLPTPDSIVVLSETPCAKPVSVH